MVLGVNVQDAVIYPQVHIQIQTQQFLRQMSVTRVGSDADDDLEREVDQIYLEDTSQQQKQRVIVTVASRWMLPNNTTHCYICPDVYSNIFKTLQ